MKTFAGIRTVTSYVQTIDAEPDAVFPLLCPVREGEWLDGWSGSVVHAESGLAEENGVYAADYKGTAQVTWLITKRDPGTHEIEFVFFVPGIQVARLNLHVTAGAGGTSRVAVEYVRTGLSEEGNAAVAQASEPERFLESMNWWERSMNHYLRTGQRLSVGPG